MIKVLLTGFEPFGKASLNPSGEILKHIKGDNIVTGLLPVAYSRSAQQLKNLIVQHKPEAIICLGQAEGRSHITPEKVAINLDDARIADNEGVMRKNSTIVVDGPDAYFSTLPVPEIVDAINAQHIASSMSLSAGAFLCNHVFYLVQHHLAVSGSQNLNVRSGFIHVPLMDEQTTQFPGLPTMPLMQMVAGIQIAIETTLEGL